MVPRKISLLGLLLLGMVGTEGASPPAKLKIGVLKRPERCSIKSRQGDVLVVHSTGKLFESNTVFDPKDPDEDPFHFILGRGQVIEGWDLGLLGMCAGEIRRLVVPSKLGYGERGAPPFIPGDNALVFEVELLKIEAKSPQDDS
jgi:FKBP-type peptidyl-prolyl cis-trans isomerase